MMIPKRIDGCTRVLGEAQGYIGLPIRDTVEMDRSTDGEPSPAMQSIWEPTPEQILALQAGGFVRLTVLGTSHPPVRLDVQRYDGSII